jgi:hypothetical protein
VEVDSKLQSVLKKNITQRRNFIPPHPHSNSSLLLKASKQFIGETVTAVSLAAREEEEEEALMVITQEITYVQCVTMITKA